MNNEGLELDNARRSLQRVALTEGEKRSMLNDIYARSNDSTGGGIPTPFHVWPLFVRHRSIAALAVAALMTTGTAYASSVSLPGDALYRMKVRVLEPAGSMLRFNETARNDYRISLLQERVREIEELKARGRLTDRTELISSRAARQNLVDIEASAALAERGVGAEVSARIETYNALVEETFRISTAAGTEAIIDHIPDPIEAAAVGVAADPPMTPIEPITDTVRETVSVAEEAVGTTIEELTEPLKDAPLPIGRSPGR